jgi:hypothetical protein
VSIVAQIVKNESVEDVVTAFALQAGIPFLDRIYGRHNEEIRRSGQLMDTYQRLLDLGVLAPGENGIAIKGPNWKEPKFLTDSRYSE